MTPALLAAALLAAPLWPSARADVPQGQKLYDQGDYPGAAAWYAQAAAADPRDAALRYDLGNALFKDGKTGRAIASYQRAFDMCPRDADMRHNLDYALRRAGEELVPAGAPPLLFLAFHLFSERELAGLQWLACWLALILAGLCLRRESLREALLPGTATALALWLGLGGWWLAVRGGISPPRRGVIVASSAELRSGPGESFSVSFTVPEGRRVQVLSANGAWLELGLVKEGVKGWLPASAVEEI
ncbi:MAG: tetratricopeptide repeat protein [Elusimicrobia bacterium]|nr:tetratricopeptide repeat protein [Elusimicrobiota bacterium]